MICQKQKVSWISRLRFLFVWISSIPKILNPSDVCSFVQEVLSLYIKPHWYSLKYFSDINFCFFAIVCLPEKSDRCIQYKVHLDNNQPQIKDKSSQRSKSIYQGIITKTYNSSLRRSLGHSFRWTSKRQIGFSVEQVCRYSSSKRSYLPKRFFSSFSQYL